VQFGVSELLGSFAKEQNTVIIAFFYRLKDTTLFFNGFCLAKLQIGA